jgi:inorganic pyrophosphatase
LIDSKKPEVPSVPINSEDMHKETTLVEIIIEKPRFGFFEAGLHRRIGFYLSIYLPANYGSIPAFIGLDDELLDAVVYDLRQGQKPA